MRESLLAKLATIATIPVIILNLIGGIVAGIWMLILGQWSLLIWGFLIMFIGSFILGLLLMIPLVIFGVPAATLFEKGKVKIGSILGLCNLAVTLIIISAWCISIFEFYLRAATEVTLIPFVIWSYGIATGELSYMASKERENEGTMATLFGAQMGYFLMLIVFLFSRNLSTSIWSFAIVMILTFFLQAFYLKEALKKQDEVSQEAQMEEIDGYLESEKVYCPKCGKEDSQGGKFCVYCGQELNN